MGRRNSNNGNHVTRSLLSRRLARRSPRVLGRVRLVALPSYTHPITHRILPALDFDGVSARGFSSHDPLTVTSIT
jgi:hypothetical protein